MAYPHTPGGAATGVSLLNFFVNYREVRYPVVLSADATVGQLAEHLRTGPLAEHARNRLLRLIAGGRILTAEDATLASCNVTDGTVVHCIASEMPRSVRGGAPGASTAGLGGGNGPDSVSIRMAAGSAGGFDRLALLGLDETEISALRLLYGGQVRGQFPPTVLPALPGEPESARMTRAEDAWMRTQDPDASEFALNLRPLVMARARAGLQNPNGDDMFGPSGMDGAAAGGRDASTSSAPAALMCGMVLGLVVGPLALLATLMMRNNSAVGRSFKLGVFFGAVVNLIYAFSVTTEAAAAATAGGDTPGTVMPVPDMRVVVPTQGVGGGRALLRGAAAAAVDGLGRRGR